MKSKRMLNEESIRNWFKNNFRLKTLAIDLTRLKSFWGQKIETLFDWFFNDSLDSLDSMDSMDSLDSIETQSSNIQSRLLKNQNLTIVSRNERWQILKSIFPKRFPKRFPNVSKTLWHDSQRTLEKNSRWTRLRHSKIPLERWILHKYPMNFLNRIDSKSILRKFQVDFE